jgi:D-serine deaminase-like pyridoxal phosphate-dependent protein
MVLRESALVHNITTMAEYCRDRGVELAPHGKTCMSPQLFQAHLDAGAWGITATGDHVRTYRSFGLSRIFLANQLVDPAAIRFIVTELVADPTMEIVCYVDSLRGVELLEAEVPAAASRVRLDVVVELGVPGGRGGCRDAAEALRVARAAAAAPHLEVVGVAGYEAAVGHGRTPAVESAVRAYCAQLLELTTSMAAAGLLSPHRMPLVSAGGSMFFDIVADTLTGARVDGTPVRVVLRSGAYVSHDHGLYGRISPFEQPGSPYRFSPALTLWGRVLSRPEPELAIVDFGRRDAPFDQDLSIPLSTRSYDGTSPGSAEGLTVEGLNDQHAFLRLPEDSALAPGDWVGCGVSPVHDLRQVADLPVVDDDDVVVGGIETYF